MFLGLDLGTSGLKALLTDADGAAVASAEATYPIHRPKPGWSEQDPADWVAACERVLADLCDRHRDEMSALQGIGTSGQMHGATLLGADGAVLRKCILWNDTRSHAEAAQLDQTKDFREISGNIVFPGFTAPKLVWVARNEPEIFEQVQTVLLPKDYLNYWLTGTRASDMSDSAGTAWLDVETRAWSDDLLAGSGMRRDQMPDLAEGCDVIGHLRADLLAKFAIKGPVAVVAGAGDNAAAACGIGAMHDGDGFVSLGTSGVLLAARDSFAPKPESAVHSFCHAVPGRWYQMGVILAATDSVNWLAGVLGDGADTLTAMLGDRPEGPGALHFLPYLAGERTPHNDAAIRGALLNIDMETSRTDLTRAVIEGVSYALRDNLEALRSTGTRLDRVTAIGGGSRSPYWLALLATVLNMPVDLPRKGEFGAALGAARLAIVGVTKAPVSQVMTAPDIATTFHPDTDLTAAYETTYHHWRKLYPALKALT